MQYKGIKYRILQTTTDGVWSWSFDPPRRRACRRRTSVRRHRPLRSSLHRRARCRFLMLTVSGFAETTTTTLLAGETVHRGVAERLRGWFARLETCWLAAGGPAGGAQVVASWARTAARCAALGLVGPDDYSLLVDGKPAGRCYLMRAAHNREGWRWTVYGVSSGGLADTLAQAQRHFKEAYEASVPKGAAAEAD